MKRMYPTIPIMTNPNDYKTIVTMNAGRFLRNIYLTSRDEYQSSLLPYNSGLGDMWISSIHRHDYAMQFIRNKSRNPTCVVSPIAKVDYWDGIIMVGRKPSNSILGGYLCDELPTPSELFIFGIPYLQIPVSIYISAVLSITTLMRYAEDKDSLAQTYTLKETVKKAVINGEAKRYAVGFYRYTGYYKEPDLWDIYVISFLDTIYEVRRFKAEPPEIFSIFINFLNKLSSVIHNLIIEANKKYPIKRLVSMYGNDYYKKDEFKNRLLMENRFYDASFNGVINPYYIGLEIFKLRFKYPEKEV